MAYNAAVTYAQKVMAGRSYTIATVLETGVVDNTHEFQVEGPILGSLTFHRAALTAGDGTATTIDPQVGESTGTKAVYENNAAAASSRSAVRSSYYVSDGILFGKSMANGSTGTTGFITTVLVLEDGNAE